MEERQALASFAALSQETRLNIIRALMVGGPDGMAAGAVAENVRVSASNVSFHLKELEGAGLVKQRRESRSIIYSANYKSLAALVRFMLDDCCAGHLAPLSPPEEGDQFDADLDAAKLGAKLA